ncbi:50S ribosomal protein L25 [Candidatus Beckwithbacteria bacterium CG10_big_fil_rev_8_21_14_0_10_34_10]|uniref:Large ribosomal subunit protein bL25 n=1 Tax=Candidatus Beckwithbacteria bacterium CG10_big_fil_rev_8_21_14_0_10_34_10 TaxID=1974495 RepID=A0A2H0WAD6_9BACT|nr:MAG: 50S ribosomal protein L25 [Candidatus Beckwithbacteria bacterium CG10_big_fil_rev_8_21_14_0_10_34_10]
MTDLNLKVNIRKVLGRKVKKLRAESQLPANIYGKGLKSQAVAVSLKDLLAIYKKAGETNIVELSLDKETKTRPVLIHRLQKDPVTDEPLHADFRQVDLKAKVQINIPVELIGEAPAVTKGGVLVLLMDEIEVEALPADLPDKFKIDISKIEEIGQGIALKDLKIDQIKVKILLEDKDQLVVQVEEPKKEEEKPVEAETPGEEDEEKKEGEAKEGEGAKEGEAKPEETKKEAEEGAPQASKEKKK